MSDTDDAEWFGGVDEEFGRPGAPPTAIPPWNPRPRPTMRPQPHTAPPHDAADRVPTDSGSSTATTVLALAIGGVLAVVLVLVLIYMFVLRKKYKSIKTQKKAAEYQVRIEDAVHVINNMDIDETCNLYANTTDLQKLVNTVRARGKSQDPLPVPPRSLKPALNSAPSSDSMNIGFKPDGDVAMRPPKPGPSSYKPPPLVPPYETVVLNPDLNSESNHAYSYIELDMDSTENNSIEPEFLIPFKTMPIEEAQLVATTESSESSITTTSISPIARPKVGLSKVSSTSSGIVAAISRPAPPPPAHAVTGPKPSVPKNSKPIPPMPPTNQKPFTLAPSINSKPTAVSFSPPSNLKSSSIIPKITPKPNVPSNPKPPPILPPTHNKSSPFPSTINSTSLNSSPQNKLLSSVKKGKLPLLPPLKTGITPSLSRDTSIDTPETAIEYLTPDCTESSPAKASISAKIAFLEGRMKTAIQ